MSKFILLQKIFHLFSIIKLSLTEIFYNFAVMFTKLSHSKMLYVRKGESLNVQETILYMFLQCAYHRIHATGETNHYALPQNRLISYATATNNF